jgi:hypothetical protein
MCAQLLPYAEDLEGLSGDLFETFLEPYFDGEFKPVSTCIHTYKQYLVCALHAVAVCSGVDSKIAF